MATPDCVFCEILSGREHAYRVSESAFFASFVPLRPATWGHLLVVPKNHAEFVWNLPARFLEETTEEVARLARLAVRELGADGRGSGYRRPTTSSWENDRWLAITRSPDPRPRPRRSVF
jgi:diadenosine tetraphosphate (Ap4A) HIT family hydrolase